MGEPIRNPKPLNNQELERDVPAEMGCAPEEPAIRVSEAEAELARRNSRSNVVAWKQTATQKAEEVKERASEVLDDAKQRASEALDEAKERASEVYQRTEVGVKDALEQGRERASVFARDARRRIRFYSQEYPFRVIAVAAGAGFLLGVVLRIWRSSRYERHEIHRDRRERDEVYGRRRPQPVIRCE